MRSALVRLAAVAAVVVAAPATARADCNAYSGTWDTNLLGFACTDAIIIGNDGEIWSVDVTYMGGSAGHWHSLWAFTEEQFDNLGSKTGFDPNAMNPDAADGGRFLYCKFADCDSNGSNPGNQAGVSFEWAGGTELIFGLFVSAGNGDFFWLFSGDPTRNPTGKGQVLEWDRDNRPLRDDRSTAIGSKPGSSYRIFGFEDTDFSNACVEGNQKKPNSSRNYNPKHCPAAEGDWDYNDAVFKFKSEFERIPEEPGIPTEVVPEPATMTLLATGLAGMAAAGRRRRK